MTIEKKLRKLKYQRKVIRPNRKRLREKQNKYWAKEKIQHTPRIMVISNLQNVCKQKTHENTEKKIWKILKEFTKKYWFYYTLVWEWMIPE